MRIEKASLVNIKTTKNSIMSRLTLNQQAKYFIEITKTKPVAFFEYENDFYKGDRTALVHEFIISNTELSFKAWLNNKGLRVRLLN